MRLEKKKNIVFIVIDTHRRDRLGMYGYRRDTSPNLDRFANTSTLFENAVSPAQWTIPAHASMFSGEYPSTHQTTQSGHSLDSYFRTMAEWLGLVGYRRIGFCNNPLVGVIDNELKRGFETFYNYGGAFPSIPAREAKGLLTSLGQIWERYTQMLRRISYPIQNAVARSEKILNLSLYPVFVPLWTSFANFKGDTKRSIEDATRYLKKTVRADNPDQHFVFINLMETHLPFTPPEPFLSQFVPYLTEERAARDFMRIYNTKALRWLLPMEEPFSTLESQTLSDFYDAEVAYQDYLLGQLLRELESPYHQENTMVILVSDHGEMLGEHHFMGHSFRVFQELIQVPLVIRFPGQRQHSHIRDVVSTQQLFHTVLDFAGIAKKACETIEGETALLSALDCYSLMSYNDANNGKQKEIFSEAYPPENVIKIMERYAPELIDDFHVRSIYRATYDQQGFKLVRGDGYQDELYRIENNGLEEHIVEKTGDNPQYAILAKALEQFLGYTQARQPEYWSHNRVNLDDESIKKRLRNLGYLE